MHALTNAHRELMTTILTRAVQARTAGDGRPFLIGHLITNRCMCECASCLWKNNDWDDLPTEQVKRLYADARDEGFVGLAISGGEPFLRNDLGELVKFAKQEAKLAILLFNTGHYLTRRMDEVLPYIDAMVVSVDAASAERHDRIRGLPGLYDRLVAGLEETRRRYPHVAVHLNSCVQRGIADEIDGLIGLASDLDVRISFDVVTEYRNGGDGERFTETSMGLPPEELVDVCRDLLERKRAGAPIMNSEGYLQYFISGSPGYRCHLPKVVMFVDGRGNLENCLNLNHPLAKLRDTSLCEAMQLPQFSELRTRAEACSSCNSPTMVELSSLWEDPQRAIASGDIGL